MPSLTIGAKAPDFKLPDQDGKITSLSDFKGKWVVLYFYPKDNTPGCTVEGIQFTAELKNFDKLGAVVLGLSPDSPKSHCNFIEKQKLKLTLLSDEDHKLLESYGAWQKKQMYGKEFMGVVRSTYLIDPQGKFAFIWSKVSPEGHAKEVLKKIKECRQSA